MPARAETVVDDAFAQEVAAHDAALRAAGLAIWVGAEPTFTDRLAQQPPWLHQALGGDKFERALALWCRLARRQPGTLMLRSEGRRYPGEAEPRWNLGLYGRRDGAPLWQGPPDPACVEATDLARAYAGFDAAAALATLGQALLQQGQAQAPLPTLDGADMSGAPRIVLPHFERVDTFLRWLAVVERWALDHGWPALLWTGAAPPVDASVALTTITPDPAVIEINAAPDADASGFLQRSRGLYAAAAAQGLAPYRLYFNGQVADSGGGGQITLGGPAPATSPFFTEPRLLPRLARFFNRHPCLSYLYAHEFVGGSGQSVRADERGLDALADLQLALALIEAPATQQTLAAEALWQSLAPFLSDAGGNSHRAEINIEKLANPFIGERGRWGLVEFRGLRMQHRPERATALACLLRAIAAMLARSSDALPLIDWGAALHDRFALPLYLQADLQQVLQRLDAAGFGLGPQLQAELQRDEFRSIGEVRLPGAVLELRRAVEFWPLLGDVAGAEHSGSSRLVDASTSRIELRLRPQRDAPASDGFNWRGWQVHIDGLVLPLRDAQDDAGAARVFGLRWRSFFPNYGLHPMLPAQSPLQWTMVHAASRRARLVTLHDWRPDGQAYDGVPQDLADAAARRAARITQHEVPASPARAPLPGEPGLSACTLDLRHRAATMR